jgi:PPOX class probable FMN-dependent enzyme
LKALRLKALKISAELVLSARSEKEQSLTRTNAALSGYALFNPGIESKIRLFMRDEINIAARLSQDQYILSSTDDLRMLYGEPNERSVLKVSDFLDENSRAFIEASPFAILATSDAAGNLDCSPRGDRSGLAYVLNDKTLLLPDRRGNNRTDSLKNIIENPNVALLFFVPAVNETFRVGGTAKISADPDLLKHFAVEGKAPKTILIVRVCEVFAQCSRALVRSELWKPEKHFSAENVPTMGAILAARMNDEFDAEEYDRELPERVRKTLY